MSSSSSSNNDKNSSLPAEMHITNRWDVCVERLVLSVSIGALTCGLVGIVLFRPGSALRGKLTMLGVGTGLGFSFAKCSQDFRLDK